MVLVNFDKNKKLTMESAATSKEKPRVDLTPNLSAVELNIICNIKQECRFRRGYNHQSRNSLMRSDLYMQVYYNCNTAITRTKKKTI